MPGVFPPLAGHLPDLFALDGDGRLLVDLVTHGLQGPIEVAGQEYDGSMPAWQQLDDEEIAAVLNFSLVSWGNADELADGFEGVNTDTVAAARSDELSPAEVYAKRQDLLGEEVAEQDEAADFADRDGWYTEEQAERGAALYMESCASCHGDNLRGTLHAPRLTELGFFRDWRGRGVDVYFDYISTRMPLDNPGSLRDADVADIVAHWLDFHDYPSGDEELTADRDLLRQITIEPNF